MPLIMKDSHIIILLLSLCLLVGVATLLTVLLHYIRYRRFGTESSPETGAGSDVAQILKAAEKPLSPAEKKYFMLFAEDRTTEEIASVMHVEPSTVYTMKHRIRKKFPRDFDLPF